MTSDTTRSAGDDHGGESPPVPDDRAASVSPAPSRRRLLLFRIAAVLLALAVFPCVEGVLALFDLGRPNVAEDPFVGFTGSHPLFVLSEDGERYEVPPARQNFFAYESFPAQKSPGTFRIVCLGGSTVQGRPYSIPTSYGTWLKLALQEADPSRNWEVVNCGGISYASYRLVPILEECLRYEPDLLILCTGHNEFLEDRSYPGIASLPRWLHGPLGAVAQTRTFTLLRGSAQRISGAAPAATDRPLLPDDPDAMLDYNEGLAAYHRDDDWQAGVIEHYGYNVRRLLTIAEEADLPVLLLSPCSNLADSPPFKSEHRAGLSDAELAEWDRLVEEARSLYRSNLHRAAALLEDALAIDDRYAAIHFELGKCYEYLSRSESARTCYVRARDEDICPLRILSPMEEELRAIAEERDVPFLDLHELLEARSRRGILGDDWLVDHVHPSFEGHQVIARRLLEMMAAEGMVEPRADWEERATAAFEKHFESLEDHYFLRGGRTLRALQAWTRGEADGPPAHLRFPERITRRRAGEDASGPDANERRAVQNSEITSP
ncbi:SGNH/GDSL hydrolase family protein [Maioricimonas sp. JC845]|uniref:SGNH/GDSL hydrolase family protein n=1 Tax=Maioricimonas sp. JC845 TaxID=3232138 RepID=UPI00345978FA